jgi:hypothetical protein
MGRRRSPRNCFSAAKTAKSRPQSPLVDPASACFDPRCAHRKKPRKRGLFVSGEGDAAGPPLATLALQPTDPSRNIGGGPESLCPGVEAPLWLPQARRALSGPPLIRDACVAGFLAAVSPKTNDRALACSEVTLDVRRPRIDRECKHCLDESRVLRRPLVWHVSHHRDRHGSRLHGHRPTSLPASGNPKIAASSNVGRRLAVMPAPTLPMTLWTDLSAALRKEPQPS